MKVTSYKGLVNWFKLLPLMLFGIAIAWMLLMHSLSWRMPMTDIPGFANGFTLQKLTVAQYQRDLESDVRNTKPSAAVMAKAIAVFSSEALTPEALAILALGADSPNQKTNLLRKIVDLNRREQIVLVSLLIDHAASNDFPSTVKYFDILVKVRPGLKQQLLPILLEALSSEESLTAFQFMFQSNPDWMSEFLVLAAEQPRTLENTAKLRASIGRNNPALRDVDRSIVLNFFNRGDVENAVEFYNQVIKNKSNIPSDHAKEHLGWKAEYPPIDWQLTDRSGMRAEILPDVDSLQLFVSDGYGGVLARRVIQPQKEFKLVIDHDLRSIQAQGVAIKLQCENDNDTRILDQRLTLNRTVTDIIPVASSCEYLVLEISARSPLGAGVLRGQICGISIVYGGEPIQHVKEKCG